MAVLLEIQKSRQDIAYLLDVCVYVCICADMYVCVYVCMYMCMYVCMCVYDVYMYVCIVLYVSVCVCACMYVCMHVYYIMLIFGTSPPPRHHLPPDLPEINLKHYK